MIVKTEAIVLKKLNFRDTSRIATLLTRDYGRLSVLAKGARNRQSNLGPILDTFNHLQVVVYKKEGRDLHLLSQCALLTRFGGLSEDLDRFGCAMSALDLVSAASHYDGEGSLLFDLLMESLKGMESADHPEAMLPYFQSRLLFLLGFQPDFWRCASCKAVLDLAVTGTNDRFFRLSGDGILCHRCRPAATLWMEIRPETLSLLRSYQQMAAGWHNEGKYQKETLQEARLVTSHFLRNHVEGVRNLKSGPVLASIMGQE
jgi:DNA repair protein RecO (recombination protein O)